ncbi:MAG: SDR family oxidoreductase [Pseudomonadota bacterium]|nr:SDR family oxidoreductase [Pseudomonadota bacterium]
MPTIVISGANRGLGLEFARQYAADGARVHAGARDPAGATALNEAAGESGGRLTVHALDVADAQSVKAFAAAVGGAPVDLVIANAGVFGGDRQHRLGAIDYDQFAETLAVNAIAPLRLADAFAANLRAAKGKFIAITSGMGSIEDGGSGYLAYRSSKAALNMICRVLANDLRPDGVFAAPMSPGWAKTDMGGPSAPQEVAPTVAAMRRRIEKLTLADSGKFLDWDGGEVAW